MGSEFVIMNVAVFGAATLQSATGIGFGIIAGPILLMVLEGGEAIHISIILNILIAGFLMPSLRKNADNALVGRFLLGSIIGIPVGLYVFLNVDIVMLKVLAGLAVSLTVFFVLRNSAGPTHEYNVVSRYRQAVPIGFIGGLMGGSLGMPGPVPAAWMSAIGCDKITIRASILVMFVFSYSAIYVLHLPFAEETLQTLASSAYLAPATIVGIVFGNAMANRFTEQVFRWVLVGVLVTTAGLLFSSVF